MVIQGNVNLTRRLKSRHEATNQRQALAFLPFFGVTAVDWVLFGREGIEQIHHAPLAQGDCTMMGVLG